MKIISVLIPLLLLASFSWGVPIGMEYQIHGGYLAYDSFSQEDPGTVSRSIERIIGGGISLWTDDISLFTDLSSRRYAFNGYFETDTGRLVELEGFLNLGGNYSYEDNYSVFTDTMQVSYSNNHGSLPRYYFTDEDRLPAGSFSGTANDPYSFIITAVGEQFWYDQAGVNLLVIQASRYPVVPEPASLYLITIGVAVLFSISRRRSRNPLI